MIISLKNQRQFDLVNSKGWKYYSRFFLAIVALDKSLYGHDELALGMKVTRKLGNAVVRNKIKRRIRHLSRLISPNLAAGRPSLVIIPKKGFNKVLFSTLLEEFNKIPMK